MTQTHSGHSHRHEERRQIRSMPIVHDTQHAHHGKTATHPLAQPMKCSRSGKSGFKKQV